ncbi:MAG: hypothetical protein HYR96_01905 [Deltaproteobacteria bacterium]|nr:hypothetical protein [Deltaproteobacteria bacterium]MBI3293359.1 hypothetical protein [Deltaproteobacteria bacterium]
MVLIAALMAALSWGADLKIDLVSELHVLEASTEQVFVDGKLFSVNSAAGAVQIYGEQAKYLGAVKIAHSMARIAPMGDHQFVVYGKLQEPWRFYYTVVDARTLQATGHEIRADYDLFPDRFVALANGEIFASDIPERGIMHYRLGGRAQKLKLDIGVPTFLAVIGKSLFAVEDGLLSSSHSNLVQVDLQSGAVKRFFDKSALPSRFSGLKLLSDGKTLAASQIWSDQVVLIDTQAGQVAKTLPVSGGPRGVGEVGHCLVVASEESRRISFWDKNTGAQVNEWSLSGADDRLKKPGTISIDPAGRIFVRSAYPCFGCQTTQSSLWVVEEVGGKTFSDCKL